MGASINKRHIVVVMVVILMTPNTKLVLIAVTTDYAHLGSAVRSPKSRARHIS